MCAAHKLEIWMRWSTGLLRPLLQSCGRAVINMADIDKKWEIFTTGTVYCPRQFIREQFSFTVLSTNNFCWNNLLLMLAVFNHPRLFLWGYIKDSMYCTQVNDLNEMKHRIMWSSLQFLRRCSKEYEYRFDIVLATKNAHVDLF